MLLVDNIRSSHQWEWPDLPHTTGRVLRPLVCVPLGDGGSRRGLEDSRGSEKTDMCLQLCCGGHQVLL